MARSNGSAHEASGSRLTYGSRARTGNAVAVYGRPGSSSTTIRLVNNRCWQMVRSSAHVKSPDGAHRAVPGPGPEGHAAAPVHLPGRCTTTRAPHRRGGLRRASAARCRPSRCAPSTRRSTTWPSWASSSQLDLGTGSARFDPNLDAHHHLVCTGCGKVRDLDVDFPTCTVPPAGRQGFSVDTHRDRLPRPVRRLRGVTASRSDRIHPNQPQRPEEPSHA